MGCGLGPVGLRKRGRGCSRERHYRASRGTRRLGSRFLKKCSGWARRAACAVDAKARPARPRTGSRHHDLVPGLLDALTPIETVLPFERTVGDEVQGLLADPQAVLEALLVVLRDGNWSTGLGIGPVDMPYTPARVWRCQIREQAPTRASEGKHRCP